MATNRPRNSREPVEETTTTKKGRLNNMEMLGIGLFFFALCLFGLSKCGGEDKPNIGATVQETVVDSTSNQGDSMAIVSADPNNQGSSFSTGEPREPAPQKITTIATQQKLYIIIDSLKMRKGPRLDSALVSYLRYGEEVLDMGERTALEKIRISVDEVRTAPWVKIKTSKGKVGWAFGAGLQFYPIAKQTNLQEEGAN